MTLENEQQKREEKYKKLAEVLKLSTMVSNIGFTMVGCILTGFAIGFFIEKYFFQKNAIIVVLFTILGVIAGFVNVYKFIDRKIINIKDTSNEKK
jgi:F0F1-type ATP synthase assembly protein I